MVDVPGAGVLLFGGFNTSPPQGGHLLSDFWAFEANGGWRRLDGTCDFELCVDGYPDVVGLAAWDPRSEKVLLVNDTGLGTFTYDPATGAFEDLQVQGPPAAVGAAMAYDEESERVIVFGGLSFSPLRVTDETWAFDPASATWQQMSPAQAPGIGNYHQMAYDPESDRMILFGGADLSDRTYDDTWAYDYNSDTWTQLDPVTSPPGRYYGDMVYDPARRQMVLFGGTSLWASATFADTWVYDPAANEWSEVAVEGPSVRAWHAMAYDDASGKVVLFGGGEQREAYQGDTWLFDPSADEWTEWQVGGLGTAACSFSDALQLVFEIPGMDQANVTCDRPYKTVDGTDLTFDLYLPPDAESRDALPAVVLVHGNEVSDPLQPVSEDWKTDMYTHGLVAAASGLAAVAVNYRGYRSGNADAMADSQQDVLDALNYLSEHGTELSIDPERLCVWTTSGGGIPGAWAALFGDPQPRCAVIFSGSLGSATAQDRSPDAFVSADMPPFFIAHAMGDQYARGSRGFVELASAAGADVTVREHPSNVDAHFEQSGDDAARAVTAEALQFMREHLGADGP